jgi:tripartite-type tricarboxylate transporter receptor subunit TctC
VIYTRADIGLDNLEKLRAKPGVRIGGQTVGHTSYVAGRLFAYFLDMKEPKFIVGYTSTEVDVALMNRELDARANAAISVLRRNPEWLEKKIMNFHAIMEIPKGFKHPRLNHLPEIETFVRNERERKLLGLWRAFRGVGSPYVAPPGTPKERVAILEEAMRKTFSDPEFPKYFRKLVDDDPSPLNAADLAKIVREMPRDVEVQDMLRKVSGADPLPAR